MGNSDRCKQGGCKPIPTTVFPSPLGKLTQNAGKKYGRAGAEAGNFAEELLSRNKKTKRQDKRAKPRSLSATVHGEESV